MSSPPLLLKGTVLDARGRPLAGARLMWLDSPQPMPDIAALSGADGGFTLGVPVTGHYLLGCQADGFAPAQARIGVGPGGATLTLHLKR